MRAAGPHNFFSPCAYKTNGPVILEGPFQFLSEVVSSNLIFLIVDVFSQFINDYLVIF